MLLLKQTREPILNNSLSTNDLRKASTVQLGQMTIKQLDEDYIHALDDPNNVRLSKRLTPSQAQLVLVRLLDVIQRQIKSGELETPDDWQAQVTIIKVQRFEQYSQRGIVLENYFGTNLFRNWKIRQSLGVATAVGITVRRC